MSMLVGVMPDSRLVVLHEIFRPWYVKALAIMAAVPTGLGAYDACCNQFGWPKLPKVWAVTLALVPWWSWLLILQAVFVYALFEYVRGAGFRQGSAGTPYEDGTLSSKVDQLNRTYRAVIDDYQRMSALESNLDNGMDQLKTSIQGQFEKVGMALQIIEGKANQATSLMEEVEQSRANITIATQDITNLASTMKAFHDNVQSSFAALRNRERLTVLEGEIWRDASDLYDRLHAGEIYDSANWNQWENVHGHWEAKLAEWLEQGTWYAMAVKEQTLSVDDKDYGLSWSVADSQFPTAEAVRRFKKFRIIQQQWEAVVPQVKSGMDLVAFVGMTELDARKGRPAG